MKRTMRITTNFKGANAIVRYHGGNVTVSPDLRRIGACLAKVPVRFHSSIIEK